MSFINRNFGNLLFLLIIGGLALGAGLAHADAEVPYLTLLKPTPTPTIVLRAPTTSGPGAAVPGVSAPATPTVAPGAAITPPAGQGSGPGRAFAGRGTVGTVQSVDDSTISVTTQDGTMVKATVNEATVYQQIEAITAADLKVGDAVVVMGQQGADGTITAQTVQVGGAAAGAAQLLGAGGRQATGVRAVAGTVQKIEGAVLTIAQQDGQTVTVTLASDARLTKTVAASLSDVKAGQQVTITGQPGADGVIAATMVQIGSLR